MSIGLTGSACPKCQEVGELTVNIEEAAHDEQLLDIVVTCGSCGSRFNSFVSIDEMDEIE